MRLFEILLRVFLACFVHLKSCLNSANKLVLYFSKCLEKNDVVDDGTLVLDVELLREGENIILGAFMWPFVSTILLDEGRPLLQTSSPQSEGTRHRMVARGLSM